MQYTWIFTRYIMVIQVWFSKKNYINKVKICLTEIGLKNNICLSKTLLLSLYQLYLAIDIKRCCSILVMFI